MLSKIQDSTPSEIPNANDNLGVGCVLNPNLVETAQTVIDPTIGLFEVWQEPPAEYGGYIHKMIRSIQNRCHLMMR